MATMNWGSQADSGAANYEEFLVPAMFAPFAERLVEQGRVSHGEGVLDVACGTGAVSRAAARRAGPTGSVTSADLGGPTLAIARSHMIEDGAAPIEYVQSDATALPFDDASFSVALCQQGLQFFPDRPAALGEMRRVLKTDGRLALATWKNIERSPFVAVADALASHVSLEASEMMRSPFGLSDASELASLLSAAGFQDVAVEDETIECTWASHPEFARRLIEAGPVASLFAAADETAKRLVTDEVAARLAPNATADGRLRMTMTSNIALARS
jgi:ubiquinone/menaquinone biosynthesis C-methylase UbiE